MRVRVEDRGQRHLGTFDLCPGGLTFRPLRRWARQRRARLRKGQVKVKGVPRAQSPSRVIDSPRLMRSIALFKLRLPSARQGAVALCVVACLFTVTCRRAFDGAPISRGHDIFLPRELETIDARVPARTTLASLSARPRAAGAARGEHSDRRADRLRSAAASRRQSIPAGARCRWIVARVRVRNRSRLLPSHCRFGPAVGSGSGSRSAPHREDPPDRDRERHHQSRESVAHRGGRRGRRECRAGHRARRNLLGRRRLRERCAAGRSVRAALRERHPQRARFRRVWRDSGRGAAERRTPAARVPLCAPGRETGLLRRGRTLRQAIHPEVAAALRATRHVGILPPPPASRARQVPPALRRRLRGAGRRTRHRCGWGKRGVCRATTAAPGGW